MTDVAVPGPVAFVTGWPVWHSRSPLIHSTWLERHGLSGRYERVGVPPEEIEDFLARLPDGPYVGGNVTIPHKEAAFRAAHRLDGAAKAIGAVNTLWLEDGRLIGGNTDAYGFSANLDDGLPGWRSAEQVVVLGAGGAARAIVHAVLSAGASRVSIVNRNPERARRVAEGFGPGVLGLGLGDEARALEAADLVVNTRPAQEDGVPLPVPDLTLLPDHALVTDIVYVPLETPFLAAARARGLVTADGLGMLLHQAVPGFERWFGLRPGVDAELRQTILNDIEKGH
ncbi:shikimate dehydrogenase [Aureimonas frigidaquae]|uniref:Shikimate dehydrogenase (NADP(+)) n=1 Tax=Aureimonas frigidaquae TaxID=424757 RepID=A0A0P0Z0T0_9HYPH|nr:shikimate dehydrogenase [Aureimonas frigidaquae]BAT27504.1 shikimate dehydrogenase [Aureimonas frigidaquae]